MLCCVMSQLKMSFIVHIPAAPSDFTAQNDTYQLTNKALIQCTPIAISSDSVAEGQECFTFKISTATSIAGLTLSPAEAEICISDSEGKISLRHSGSTRLLLHVHAIFCAV